eukprot:GHVR01120188.1.p1 GENE.GHVR01120188.1~~GHVR01120188.1.p1  ORF type:complete len:245 (+),score=51.86 GHVR01120188.1:450-1184(+)
MVDRVNKLVLVIPLKSRYQGAVGDVVVGRVEEVGQQRWFVEMHSGVRGQLLLNAINLPDSIQRRRTEEDEREMRKYFIEGDVVSTEVQKCSSDSVNLHTRSARYGKLENGCLVKVLPQRVNKQQHHICTLKCGALVILGNNGAVWIGVPPQASHLDTLNFAKFSSGYAEVCVDMRLTIARVRNSVLALCAHYVELTPQVIEAVYAESINQSLEAKDLLREDVKRAVVEKVITDGGGRGAKRKGH